MALPTSIELQIVTPDRLILREQVDEVEIPGSDGYFGVLPGHTPLLASLAVGEHALRRCECRIGLALIVFVGEVRRNDDDRVLGHRDGDTAGVDRHAA